MKYLLILILSTLISCADSEDKNLSLEADLQETSLEDLSFSEYRPKQAKYLVIHCIATDPKYPWSVERLATFFKKERKWNRYGYNYYIRQDGTIEELTPINDNCTVDFDELTYNAAGYNSITFAVSLEGGSEFVNKRLVDKDNFTLEQKASLIYITEKIKGICPDIKVIPHNELNKSKSCPVLQIEFLQ